MNHIAQLRDLLGPQAVLLAVPSGRKGPVLKDWQKVRVEKMEDDEYLLSLGLGNNIGVLLGEPSSGLCTIDLDRDSDVEVFLRLNPRFRETLRTKRGRGCNIWIRVSGGYPPLSKIQNAAGEDCGEWRATGGQTVISGKAPDKATPNTMRPYLFLNEVSPIEITFKEINWPENWILPWEKPAASPPSEGNGLIESYGSPFFRDSEGKLLGLNENYWAGLYAKENLVLFEPDEKQFYRYHEKTGLYTIESADAIKREISARILVASRQDDVDDLQRKRGNNTLTNIVAQLKGIVEVRGAFSNKQRIVHLANGVLEFKDGDANLMPFNPLFRSRNASPIPYNENAKCDRFLNELVIPAVHAEDLLLLQKYSGMCLLAENIIQRMLILDGLAGRGKTQFANAIQGLIGMVNCTQLRTEFLGERFEIYRFLKKALLVGVDVPSDFLSTKGASVLKGLVGGDWYDAEQKGGTGSFQVQGKFCVLATSNSRLRVRLEGDDGAWKRRLLIVRYESPPPKMKIADFGAVLVREEGSGILNWALQGLGMLLEDMRTVGDIALTPRQTSIVDSLLAESESLRHFLQDSVELREDSDLTVAEIVEAYAEFCPTMGWKAMPVTVVHDKLEVLMLELFRVTKSHNVREVRGFRRVAFK